MDARDAAGVLFALAVICAAVMGCTTPMVAVPDSNASRDTGVEMDAFAVPMDAGVDSANGVDAASAVDAASGVDAASADTGTRDAGTGTGPTSLRGAIVSLAGASVSGSIVLVDQGFERGGRVCSGTTCVVGGIEP